MKHHNLPQQNDRNPVIISEGDFEIIKNLVGHPSEGASEMSLAYELSRAIVVRKEAFPPHTIGLNATVSVLDLDTKAEKTFTLVTPSLANIQKGNISILSPMGAAVIGFRKGEEVVWKMPGGLKRFRILDVYHKEQETVIN